MLKLLFLFLLCSLSFSEPVHYGNEMETDMYHFNFETGDNFLKTSFKLRDHGDASVIFFDRLILEKDENICLNSYSPYIIGSHSLAFTSINATMAKIETTDSIFSLIFYYTPSYIKFDLYINSSDPLFYQGCNGSSISLITRMKVKTQVEDDIEDKEEERKDRRLSFGSSSFQWINTVTTNQGEANVNASYIYPSQKWNFQVIEPSYVLWDPLISPLTNEAMHAKTFNYISMFILFYLLILF